MQYKLFVYIGSLHDELDRETITYSFYDINKMFAYINFSETLVKSKGMYYSYIIEEIHLEEKLEEKPEDDRKKT